MNQEQIEQAAQDIRFAARRKFRNDQHTYDLFVAQQTEAYSKADAAEILAYIELLDAPESGVN